MANIQAAKKSIRQTEKRYLLNRALRRRIVTWRKKLEQLIAGKDKKAAQEAMKTFTQVIDKAAKKRVYHPNKAARFKSRLQKQINTLE